MDGAATTRKHVEGRRREARRAAQGSLAEKRFDLGRHHGQLHCRFLTIRTFGQTALAKTVLQSVLVP